MCSIIFWGSGKIFHVFEASTCEKLQGKITHKKNGTRKLMLNIRHSAIVVTFIFNPLILKEIKKILDHNMGKC